MKKPFLLVTSRVIRKAPGLELSVVFGATGRPLSFVPVREQRSKRCMKPRAVQPIKKIWPTHVENGDWFLNCDWFAGNTRNPVPSPSSAS